MGNTVGLRSYLESERDRLVDANIDEKEVKSIKELIRDREYEGIIVYPHVVHWEPLQTPQQILRGFAKRGWICFFCEHPALKDAFREQEHNLFIVHEKEFVNAINDVHVWVLYTWMGSSSFINLINNKSVWYHILDDLEIFPYYGDYYEKLHYEVIRTAQIISYVASPLRKWLRNRDDAFCLPNGVNVDEFLNIHENFIPKDIKNIVLGGKKIIGYYGYLAEWMDYKLVRAMALERPDYDFVFIGKAIYDTSMIDTLKNVRLLGLKRYDELSDYAKWFDVAIIPFVVDEKMDCVSPIKFYEYCALGLPTVVSKMTDMIPYANEFIRIADGKDEFEQSIDELLNKSTYMKAQEGGKKVASNHTWIARVEKVISIMFRNSVE